MPTISPGVSVSSMRLTGASRPLASASDSMETLSPVTTVDLLRRDATLVGVVRDESTRFDATGGLDPVFVRLDGATVSDKGLKVGADAMARTPPSRG